MCEKVIQFVQVDHTKVVSGWLLLLRLFLHFGELLVVANFPKLLDQKLFFFLIFLFSSISLLPLIYLSLCQIICQNFILSSEYPIYFI